MAFKMKSKGELLGINEELSTYDRPVFEKDLEEDVIAEANRDGTTFVEKDASEEQKAEGVIHENEHHDQMGRGDLDYTDDTLTWKGKTIARKELDEGNAEYPWEAEAYTKTKKKKKKNA